MISRSDWEPLPTPTLSPFARGYLSLCRFFHCRRVWCVPALRVPLVHSLINHFRVRVAAVLTPARGKRPTTSAWAIEAHDVGLYYPLRGARRCRD